MHPPLTLGSCVIVCHKTSNAPSPMRRDSRSASTSSRCAQRPHPQVYDPTPPSALSNALHSIPTPLHCRDVNVTPPHCKSPRIRDSLLQLLRDLLVDRVTEVLHGARLALEYDRGGVVWGETSGFSVYPYEVKGAPEGVEQFVDV